MTASTRTVTLSRVMPSWAGTGIVMICMFTFCRRSATGTSTVSPGPRTPSCTRPKRNTTPRSNCLTTRTLAAQPERTQADCCSQGIKDGHDVLHFRLDKTRRYFSASAGDSRADEMSTSLQYGPIAGGVSQAAILVTAAPSAPRQTRIRP